MPPKRFRKVHFSLLGKAACGSVPTTAAWPHLVGPAVWPAVVDQFKCKACDRLFKERDNLGTTPGGNTSESNQA